MEEAKSYIVEINSVMGDETTIYLEDKGKSVESLYAVISIAERGACVVDTCYRSIAEAQQAWPKAIPPKPYHLSPEAIRRNYIVKGETPNKKLM
jgi:hypothetical protein